MSIIESRALFTLAALVAGASLFVPAPADAALAMFRVERAWHGFQGDSKQRSWSRGLEPSSMQPPAIASVGTTTVAGKAAQKFTLPRGFIDASGTSTRRWWYVGYLISVLNYSSQNLQGRFRPFNPYGATMTTVLRFPTTMSSTLPPTGVGEPITPTTTFPLNTSVPRGNFDFSRGGSIRVSPGPHRFGGTMRYFSGPNSLLYQYITFFTGLDPVTRGYFPQPQWQRTEYDEAELREIVSGGYGHLYVFTFHGIYRVTDGYGNPRTDRVQHIYSEMPWTTGTVRVYEPLWPHVTTLTYQGGDSRTPAGWNGKISLVSARLRHSYRIFDEYSGESTRKMHSTASVSTLEVTFLPEPEAVWMLGAGIVALAALVRLRRR